MNERPVQNTGATPISVFVAFELLSSICSLYGASAGTFPTPRSSSSHPGCANTL